MLKPFSRLTGAALVALAVPALLAPVPLAAQEASESDAKAAAGFIDSLAGEAFDVIRAGDPSSSETRATLRDMLAENFDVGYIGNYLIRRHRSSISEDQYKAYMSIFPRWVVGAYTNNLFAFKDARLNVIRAVPRGARGDIEVYTRVNPASGSPINAVWQVRKSAGEFKIRNLKVSNVNMAVAQEEDFNAFIRNRGFDALVEKMRERAA